MTYGVAIMYLVAAVLGVAGLLMLLRLRSPRVTERQVYAYRMVGIMAASAAIVLAMSATAMWQWSLTE
ncbi:hypothetical protein Q5H91_13710 [Sphingomonas sp. KR1UV-12]|uniref:Uncharacterized protein n=1 Tax=Sphingomonas aurea TaxID=3063994 RepID=A0ABT9EN86_9SPHN|nr:hypothetical protein [Sphingomonas sp. KR1UV-12]MDP1028276.1 hypothetical protein [Sphingomonas sp. KR1UV-12]